MQRTVRHMRVVVTLVLPAVRVARLVIFTWLYCSNSALFEVQLYVFGSSLSPGWGCAAGKGIKLEKQEVFNGTPRTNTIETGGYCSR